MTARVHRVEVIVLAAGIEPLQVSRADTQLTIRRSLPAILAVPVAAALLGGAPEVGMETGPTALHTVGWLLCGQRHSPLTNRIAGRFTKFCPS